MTTNPVARKLGLTPKMRALVVAAPPVYLKLLAPLPEGAVVSSTAKGTYPFVQFFAASLAEIRKSVPKLLKHAARLGNEIAAEIDEGNRMASRIHRCHRRSLVGAAIPASGRCQN